MNKIKELLYILKNADYKDLFIALILNDKIDYIQDIEDLQEEDITYLETIYKEFIENDTITSLINPEILDMIEEKGGENVEPSDNSR